VEEVFSCFGFWFLVEIMLLLLLRTILLTVINEAFPGLDGSRGSEC
jgi:hypothetical protein